MQTLQESKNIKVKPILLFLVILVIVAVYQFLLKKEVISEGVYTKCVLTDSKPYKGGITITVNYKYADKEYSGRLSSSLGTSAIGNQYFIKLLPKNPEAIVFLKENPVPNCLLKVEAPPEGWKQLPECK